MVTYNTSEGELVESLNQSADEFKLYEYDDRYSSSIHWTRMERLRKVAMAVVPLTLVVVLVIGSEQPLNYQKSHQPHPHIARG